MSVKVAWILFTLCSCVVFALEPPSISKQYRTDYQYNRETDAFYKMHLQSKSYDDAKQTCINEGAELMIPASKWDVMQFRQMINNYPCFGELWIGHEELPKDKQLKETTDSTTKKYVTENPFSYFEPPTESLHDAITRNAEIIEEFEMRDLPFICKVKAEDAPFNSDCGVYAKDYECNATVGSCYKISNIPMSWVKAYSKCRREGSHLVILNSETEQQVVLDLLNRYPHYIGPTSLSAGFRAKRTYGSAPRVFKTIFGETLEEAGYDKWTKGEPNNYGGDEYCGSVNMGGGKLNDIFCYEKDYPYICEKEISRRVA